MPATSSPAIALRYRDVAAAVDWLCTAFGFQKQTVVTGEAGAIDFAQLTCGRALLMLAPVRDTPLDKLMKQPDEIGGAATQSCYLVVEDADAHYARAKDSGAEIVLDLQDDDFGGRGYACRDPEGHTWMFGTYDPWQGKYPEPVATAQRGGGRRVVLAGAAMTVIASVVAMAWVGGVLRRPRAVTSAVLVQEQPAAEKTVAEAKERAGETAGQAARELRAQLERERAAKAAADKASEDALQRMAEAQRAREAAERAANEVRAQLERERVASAAADKTSEGALQRFAEAQRARAAAERAATEARAQLERERVGNVAADKASENALQRVAEAQRAREAAERAAREARAQLERERTAATAAEMAKEFALGRADEERLAREAAERAAKEARAQLAKAPEPAETDAAKRVAEVKRALDRAQRQAADEQRAREAAERAAREARQQLAREKNSRTAAWRAVARLRQRLREVQGYVDDEGPPPEPQQKKASESE